MTAPIVVSLYKPGNGFNSEYVTRLKASVAEYCKVPHRFVCMTRQDIDGVECIPLIKNRIGYWNKLEIFRSGLFDGPVIYLDLDTMIVSDITDIVTYPHEFTAAHNWKGKPGESLSSWFLGFDGRQNYQYLFDSFHPSMTESYEQDWRYWGDQGHIEKNLVCSWTPLGTLFPNRFVSYKWGVKPNGRVPEEASIVVFHGRPRPHQIKWRLPNGVN
jgi:hypothetical protein